MAAASLLLSSSGCHCTLAASNCVRLPSEEYRHIKHASCAAWVHDLGVITTIDELHRLTCGCRLNSLSSIPQATAAGGVRGSARPATIVFVPGALRWGFGLRVERSTAWFHAPRLQYPPVQQGHLLHARGNYPRPALDVHGVTASQSDRTLHHHSCLQAPTACLRQTQKAWGQLAWQKQEAYTRSA